MCEPYSYPGLVKRIYDNPQYQAKYPLSFWFMGLIRSGGLGTGGSSIMSGMSNEKVKIVVFVPKSHGDAVRKALGDSGAGVIGDYHHCSISVEGVGRFIPGDNAKPYIGEVGVAEEVVEERIETPCNKSDLKEIIKAVKDAHPYEHPVIEIYPMLNVADFE